MGKWQVFWLTSFALAFPLPGGEVARIRANPYEAYSFRKSSGFAPDSLLIFPPGEGKNRLPLQK